MESIQLTISKLMIIGIVISLLLVAGGGIFYLSLHGSEIVSFSTFHQEPQTLTSIRGILRDAISLAPRGIIQLGLLVLLLTQVLRVILTTWFFAKIHNSVFVWISLFILAVLIYSVFWHF